MNAEHNSDKDARTRANNNGISANDHRCGSAQRPNGCENENDRNQNDPMMRQWKCFDHV